MDRNNIHNKKGTVCQSGRLQLLSASWRRRLAGGILLFLLVGSFVANAQTQIGGAVLPLKYSIHTYTITMGLEGNDVQWNIYDDGATRETIDDSTFRVYSSLTAYRINAGPTQNLGVASITIDFTGNLVPGTTYLLTYREQSSEECYTYEFFSFTLQYPFDVDLDPDNTIGDNTCPDSALVYVEGTGFPVVPVTYTTIDYHVVIVDPDGIVDVYDPRPPNAGNITWSFYFSATVTGQSGTSAIISEINYGTVNIPNGTSTYTSLSPVSVSNMITDFVISVTYIDVPGVQQKIDFTLFNIEGAYQEDDIDVKVPLAGQNEMAHYIDAMPGPSYIIALD